MKNPNDKTAHIYDIVNAPLKGKEVTDAELELIRSLLPEESNADDVEILDIGAGTGRHTIPLAKLGYKMVAIDASSQMLKVLSERAKALNIDINILNEDIMTFDIDAYSKFDLVIMMWNSFNEIVHEESSALKLLEKLKSALKQNGKILVNIDDSDKLDMAHINFHTEYSKDNYTYLQDWKVVDFDAPGKTTTSKETISVIGEDGKLNEKHESEIVQTWWCRKSMRQLAQKLGMRLTEKKIRLNEEIYFVLRSTLS